MEKSVLDFLQTNSPQLCVMSTVDETGKPESAVLAYVVHEDLSITISTHSTTRKWKNLQSNKNVSVIFGWDFTHPNIQYEGTAETMEKTHKDYSWHEEKYFSTHPELKRFESPDSVFIKVTPNWIRFTDFSAHPPKVEEKRF